MSGESDNRRRGWCRRVVPGALLVAWIGVPYLLLQRVEWRPVTVLAPDPLTGSLPFLEWSVWIYLSLYPFLGWAGLACRDDDFPRFVCAGALAAGLAHVVFLFFPTGVARPELPEPGFAYRWLVAVDRPRNALPSLHAALVVLGVIVLWRRFPRGTAAGVVAAAWGLLILVSTMTLRQHVAGDLAAGGVLAGCAWAAGGRLLRRRQS